MIHAGRDGIADIGGAKLGDKTLIDALTPAVDAFDAALAAGKPFSACLRDMAAAAGRGRDSTTDMVAKLGRASRLGERSRGVIDAGAASCCLILETMANSIGAKVA